MTPRPEKHTWGGKRPGAGRKPLPEEDVLRGVPFKFRASLVEHIRELVEETGLTADEIVAQAFEGKTAADFRQ